MSRRPILNVCYLLESTELSGGVRVVLDQARAMAARGHKVTVLARRGDVAWYPYPVRLHFVEDIVSAVAALRPDVVIATFWTTVESAIACQAPLTVHLCQGLEWECPEYNNIAGLIEAAYRHPIPKLTIGPWLDDKLRQRFGASLFPIASIGQCVDTRLYHSPSPICGWLGYMLKDFRKKQQRQPRLLIPGMFEASVKGIRLALQAVALLRNEGRLLQVVRVSSLPQHAEENTITMINTYHQAVTPRRMAALYREADIVMTPSYAGEGFGLPFAEALASGTAVVATTIPSYLSLDPVHDYARLVPEGSVGALAAAVRDLLDHPIERRRMAKRGNALLRGRYSNEAVAARLDLALHGWMESGHE